MRPHLSAAILGLTANCSAEGKRVNGTIRHVTSLIDMSQISQNICCTPTSLLLF